MKKLWSLLLALLLLLCSACAASVPQTAAVRATAPASEATPTPSPVPEGPITDPQSIADYLFANGCLPENFITKDEAMDLGWDSRTNYVGDVAPGMSIGGDPFGNYEGLLPRAKGRQYYEADCYYEGRKRNRFRIVYAEMNGEFEGLVYYTEDHYKTFEQMFPSIPQETEP